MNENIERETTGWYEHNLNIGAVEKQKWAVLQTRGLYVLHTENIKVETNYLLRMRYRRFSHSIE